MENEADSSVVILALHRATHVTLHELGGRLAHLGLAAADINALANLATGGRRSVSALAAATGSRPSTLTSALDRLTRHGYVVRELDPADLRSLLVSLTPAGQEAAGEVMAAVRDIERQVLAGVTAADLAGFHTLTRAITEVPR